jgi:hypothetical protein
MRRAAKILRLNRKTVARKIAYLAKVADLSLESTRAAHGTCPEIHLDELITFEHTRCKPVAVAMAVSKERAILAFAVSPMPPMGVHLRKIALEKYGKRPNLRRKGLAQCLRGIQPHVGPRTVFMTDEEPSYPSLIRGHYPGREHRRFRSRRAVIAGQGELKDHSFDPLFAINHTFAMLRANLARLVRRTWVTTKKLSRLEEFLKIYAAFHNAALIGQAS